VKRLPGLHRLFREERGAALTEFGLLLLPMCLVLMGGLDMGMQLYYRSQLQGALNDVARAAEVETPQLAAAGSTLDSRIDQAIRDRVGQLVKNPTYTITKTNYYRFASIGRPERLDYDRDNDGRFDAGDDCWVDEYPNNTFDSSMPGRTGRGGADDVVIYEVNLRANRLLPVMGLFGASAQYDLTARTTVRNQPFAAQARPAVVC
jgi:Flp pilus assembly pilin Flp